MRIARKLFLLSAMALTAMALTAGTAAAQETAVEVSDEAGTVCTFGCVVHADGIEQPTGHASSQLIQHTFGHEEVISRCVEEFDAVIYSDGSGEIHSQHLEDPALEPGVCTRQACDSAGESEWPITDSGELGPGEGHMTVRFCLEPVGGGTEIHCDAEVHIDEEANHRLVFSTDQHCPVFPGIEAEVSGSWETEADEGLEITHL